MKVQVGSRTDSIESELENFSRPSILEEAETVLHGLCGFGRSLAVLFEFR